MAKAVKFYQCKVCGNLVEMINDSGAVPVCCGQEMTELTVNTVEASVEKHLPVVSHTENTVLVSVGSAAHPMLEEHYIVWIYLHTEKGSQIKYLNPGEDPKAVFTLEDDKPVSAYAYCNLHGLWKTDI